MSLDVCLIKLFCLNYDTFAFFVVESFYGVRGSIGFGVLFGFSSCAEICQSKTTTLGFSMKRPRSVAALCQTVKYAFISSYDLDLIWPQNIV